MLLIHIVMTLQSRVSPFGNLRIKVCSQLPEAYRNVLRPSSPLNAKASTKRPFHTLLNSQTFFIQTVFLWSGGYGEGRTPDTIPNSVVKTLSADGTLS